MNGCRARAQNWNGRCEYLVVKTGWMFASLQGGPQGRNLPAAHLNICTSLSMLSASDA